MCIIRKCRTIKEITIPIMRKHNSSYSIEAIRVLMIREIKMSYKRVKSRPNSFDIEIKLSLLVPCFLLSFQKSLQTKHYSLILTNY